MNKDFHCYATYCAAILAGYSHEDSRAIGYSSQMTDLCTRTMLSKIHGPLSAATTQLQLAHMGVVPLFARRFVRCAKAEVLKKISE